MTELQKKLTDIGGFATLRKTKTIDRELTRKVQSDHISRKLQGMSTMTQELQKYDKLSWPEFLVAIRNTRVPLTNLPREELIIYLTGDIALSSLDVKSLKEVEKVNNMVHRNIGSHPVISLQRGDCGYNRKYVLEFDPFLNSQTAVCRQTLRERVMLSLDQMSALPDKVLVGLNIGVCRRMEKMDPAQTVNNLIEIHKQFKEKVIYS
mgnify:CR=1 FL=1